MKAAGIVQDGDPVLHEQAVPFRLPDEEDEANSVIAELFGALQRTSKQHVFSRGMGVAAPQIGIGRAAAIVIPSDPGAEPLVMFNLQVISESAETDEQYEGCLSFFDVRGLVPRPLHIEVACTRPDGGQYVLALDNAMARPAVHEIDHLAGRLYTSRMREGVRPIPSPSTAAPGARGRIRLSADPTPERRPHKPASQPLPQETTDSPQQPSSRIVAPASKMPASVQGVLLPGHLLEGRQETGDSVEGCVLIRREPRDLGEGLRQLGVLPF
jgi:peptide deformylase